MIIHDETPTGGGALTRGLVAGVVATIAAASTPIGYLFYRAVARAAGASNMPKPGRFDTICGLEDFTSAVLVDQSPPGRTARGNAATNTKA